LFAAVLCAQVPPLKSRASKRRCIANLLREVADSLGNTPSVCRKSYVDPRVLDCFNCGETITTTIASLEPPIDLSNPLVLGKIETAVISMLEGTGTPITVAAA
jgi:DNA topoisomerase IB